MRFTVFLPGDLVVRHDAPLDRIELAPFREPEALESPDDDVADEDDLFGDGVALTDSLRLEGQLEWRSIVEDDFNLNGTNREDRVDLTTSLRSRLVWRASDALLAVAELRYGYRWRDDEDDGRSSAGDADLGEAFVHWQGAFGDEDMDLVVGRQDFDEPREWIYDQNLDAIRWNWRLPVATLEVSNSTTLADGDRFDRESTNWIVYLSNANKKKHAAVWSVLRDFNDQRASDESLHIGARAFGDWFPNSTVWLDVAHLSGRRAGVDVDAWAYDVGVTWTPKSVAPLSFTIGYAYASGDDDPADGTDNTFRQTGLQDNNARFDGVTSFRYYGELVDPELSNLGIVTLGVGTRLAKRSSLDLVFHRFLQDEAAPLLQDSDLGASPGGISPHLGWEVDLVFGARESKRWDVEFVAAYFDPSSAFTDDDEAFLLKGQVRWRF